jgi:hypothetical protein
MNAFMDAIKPSSPFEKTFKICDKCTPRRVRNKYLLKLQSLAQTIKETPSRKTPREQSSPPRTNKVDYLQEQEVIDNALAPSGIFIGQRRSTYLAFQMS